MGAQARALARGPSQDGELLAQQEVLGDQIAAGSDGRAEQRDEEQHVVDHRCHDRRLRAGTSRPNTPPPQGRPVDLRRLKQRSGVTRLHAHLCRHTVAQNALLKGAGRAEVQDILGHQTDAMARKYAGKIRQVVAAKNMARYSVV